jgi:hypothetical protein
MHHVKLVCIKEFSTVHGHYQFSDMTGLVQVFGKRTGNIAQPACFGYGITFCANMKNLHKNLSPDYNLGMILTDVENEAKKFFIR